jgi:3-hydroxy acid dehydrogenase / malonic semialdehyde reductase
MTDPSFTALRALVTGASSGIGEATVRHLRAAGYEVTAVARRAERLAALAADTGSEVLALDVTDTAQLYARLSSRRFDVLVNNAGVGRGFEGLLAASPDDIERTLRTNVEAAIHVVRAVLPAMVAQHRGHVVHLGSVAGLYPIRSALYGASKGATHLFAQNLRLELAGTGVRTTEIVPGRVTTEFFDAAIDDPAQRGKARADITELTSDDVARAIVWALSAPPHMNVTTLEVLPTDQAIGGVVLRRSDTGSP